MRKIARRSHVLPLILCICIYSAILHAQRVNDASVSVRYDGLYFNHFDDGTAGGEYLRFYPDGTVVSVLSIGAPQKVALWLTREHPNAAKGTYKIQRTTITFSTTRVFRGKADPPDEFKGSIEENRATLVLYAQDTKKSRNYRFIQLPVK